LGSEQSIKEALERLLRRRNYVPATAEQLQHELHLQNRKKGEFHHALHAMERDGLVARIKGNRYVIPREADLIPGKIRMNRQGKGFLDPDDPALPEIAVPPNATGTAMHEDHVLVRRDVRRGGAAGPGTGTVIRVIERRRTTLVGTLQQGRRFMFVIPDDPRLPRDVYVPPPRDVGRPARVGDKVVVELGEWPSKHEAPEGEIIEVLGPPDAEGVDMLSVLRQYSLPLRFPKPVLEEARRIGSTVNPEDFRGRVDCRGHLVITIDPEDAKDFDDAICITKEQGGRWRLWVHIADVSHYVKPGSALDQEAGKRGNSTYLVDRVIPMLPEALSNELCSLKPDVERLTKCVEFLLAEDGRVLQSKFHSAVIKSKRRFSYPEAFEVLQREPRNPIESMLHDANQIAQRIRKARFRAGSLDLDFPESKVRLDEEGKVQRIERVVNDESHQLIEEFMLLANEAVARKLMENRTPSIYRVHEQPNEERLEEFREEVLSHDIPCGDLRKRNEVQRLMQRLNQSPAGPALKIGFLKSLMRARYAVEPLGHYGLAKSSYTHFTSPIRRYADLMVHRTLFEHYKASLNSLRQTASHISDTERNSDDAERDSRDVKMFAFLKEQLSSDRPVTYNALVTQLRNFGFFVDVPDLGMSGLVPLSSIEEDFFVFEPDRNQLIGRRTRRAIRIGDRVPVQVAKVDTYKRQVDFKLAVQGQAQPRGGRHYKRRRPFKSG
jgi:ribonuclease R